MVSDFPVLSFKTYLALPDSHIFIILSFEKLKEKKANCSLSTHGTSTCRKSVVAWQPEGAYLESSEKRAMRL